jgi:hypothetical protein
MKPLPKADRHGRDGENDRRPPVQRDMRFNHEPADYCHPTGARFASARQPT